MINIRPVKPEEWQKLCLLNKQIFVKNPEFDEDLIVDFANSAPGQAYFKDSISSTEGVCLVAEEDDVWLGYVNGNPKEIPYRHSKYFEIENLGVTPDAKGKGIGKRLLQALVDWAKQ